MKRKIILTGAFIGMLAIILGAFGAHLLKKYLSVEQLVTFETGVRYQMYHAFFLFFLKSVNNFKSLSFVFSKLMIFFQICEFSPELMNF